MILVSMCCQNINSISLLIEELFAKTFLGVTINIVIFRKGVTTPNTLNPCNSKREKLSYAYL